MGVSSLANTHTEESPVLGTGQGDGDGPARWLGSSCPIIRAYKKKAHPFVFQAPDPPVQDKTQVATFVDDAFTATSVKSLEDSPPSLYTTIASLDARDDSDFTSLDQPTQHLVAKITENTQRWADLVNVPGQRLELQKCECIPFVWKVDEDGNFTAVSLPADSIKITEPDTGEVRAISLREMSEACKHMGVRVRGDRSMKDTIETKKSKSDDYATMFARTPISGVYAQLSYRCSYCPKVRHGLVVATMTFAECHRVQQQAVHSFLPKMGFNRHVPLPIVFAPVHFGGIDMYHVYTMQGFDKIQMVTRHLRIRSTLATKFKIQLDCYQLRIGTGIPALQDFRAFSHAHDKWIDSFRQFLADVNGKFIVHNIWIPNSPRQNDRYIMEEFMQLTTNKQTLDVLNNVRIALQVIFLSELLDNSGKFIAGADADPTDTGTPALWATSQSNLQWPFQPLPGKTARKSWMKFLRKIDKTKLGVSPWREEHSMERAWKQYQSSDYKWLFRRHSNGTFTKHKLMKARRRDNKYSEIPDPGTIDDLPPGAFPSPGKKDDNFTVPFAKYAPAPSDPPVRTNLLFILCPRGCLKCSLCITAK